MGKNYEDEEDFVVDDILKNRDKKKKKVNGKKKGSRVERELTKILNTRFNCEDFSRSVGSGNRWGQVNHLPKHARIVFSGDLIVPANFKFCIESKGGYDGIDLNAVFDHGSTELDHFLEQAVADSIRCDRKPMLCWKKTRKNWMAFVKKEELKEIDFKYMLKYGEWVAVALDKLLEMPDEFFLNLE
jgi:hypothetical protein